jgi:hypothetical protein
MAKSYDNPLMLKFHVKFNVMVEFQTLIFSVKIYVKDLRINVKVIF